MTALWERSHKRAEMDDNHAGLQARLMPQAPRKLTSMVAKTNTCVIFTNLPSCLILVFLQKAALQKT